MLDSSDATSSVSFNTGVLCDQFDNMDSISQIMGNDVDYSSQGPQIDLKNVNAEIQKRDQKIQDLLSDRTKLKGLLKKAKNAIDSINMKYKQSQENSNQFQSKMGSAMEKNTELLQTLEIVQKQKTSIDR